VEEFPHTSSAVVRNILSFPPTYLHKRAFFKREMKYQNKLTAEHNMRIWLFKTVPDFKITVASKQVYMSHQISTIKTVS
jgi:hypothetical protein